MKDLRCELCRSQNITDPDICDSCIELHQKYAQLMGREDPVTKIQVCATYYSSVTETIQLPLYKTWDDVEDQYIKYDVFHYKLKGEHIWREVTMDGPIAIGDTKRPISYSIHSEDYITEYVDTE